MSYLITGGTGFIGAHIAGLLFQDGEEVVTYDIGPRREILDYLLSGEGTSRLKVISGDIRDLAHILRVVKEHHATTIIHMAAVLTIEASANPALALQVNCGGMVNILETARILGVEKLIYASSNTVFGPAEKYKEEFIPNDAPHYPSTVYASCKSFNERLAEHYFKEYGVDSIGLRFPVVYGTGHIGGMSALITEELMAKPALGRPGRVPCGDDTLNWLYVEDAARAVLMSSKKGVTKTKCFNIDGEICSVASATELVKKLIPEANITLLPGYTGFSGRLETSKIREEIGYRPQWTLEKGIEQVVNETRKRDKLRVAN